MRLLLILPLLTLVSSVLFAEEQTYLLAQPNMAEWQPPVETVRELPKVKVKKAHVIRQGGRSVTVEKCEDVHVKPKVRVVNPTFTDVTGVTEVNDDYVSPDMIHISATVYMENGKPFSHIRLSLGKEKVEAWSSMNVMEMAGMNHYVARGIEYYALVGHGIEQNRSAREAGCPVDRDRLNREKARFIVVGERVEDSKALEAMRGLHAIYNKERVAIKAAHVVRVENQKKARAWKKANPPKPKDVTVRFWKRNIEK